MENQIGSLDPYLGRQKVKNCADCGKPMLVNTQKKYCGDEKSGCRGKRVKEQARQKWAKQTLTRKALLAHFKPCLNCTINIMNKEFNGNFCDLNCYQQFTARGGIDSALTQYFNTFKRATEASAIR